MLRSILVAGLAGLMGLFTLSSSQTVSQEVELLEANYLIRNVASAAEADTASLAAEIATQRAVIAAFRELVTRLVPESRRHEVLAPSTEQLALLMSHTRTINARKGLRSASVVLDIELSAEEVHHYLNDLHIPFSIEAPQRLVLVPIVTLSNDKGVELLEFNDDGSTFDRLVEIPAVEWIVTQPQEPTALNDDRVGIDAVTGLNIAFSHCALGGYVLHLSSVTDQSAGTGSIRVQANRFGSAYGPDLFVREYGFGGAIDADGMEGAASGSVNPVWTLAAYEQAVTELNAQISDHWTEATAELHGPTNAIGVVVLDMTSDDWFAFAPELETELLVKDAEFVQTRQGILDVTVQFYGTLENLQQLFRSREFQFDAYSLVDQPNVVGFLLRPLSMETPQGVRLLDLNTIRLSY